MRFQTAILLLLTIFLAGVQRSCSAIHAYPLNLSLSRSDQNRKTLGRFLRLGDEENRMAPVSALETAIKAAMPQLTNSNKLLLRWYRLKNKRIDKTLKSFDLGKNVDTLLTDPKLSILLHYVPMYNKKNLKNVMTTAEVLATKYGLAPVTKLLEKAKTSKESSEATKTLAKELQLEQFTGWTNQKLSPVDVYRKLELNTGNLSPLGSPVFEAWAGFVRKSLGQNEDKAASTMLEALQEINGKRGAAVLFYEAKGFLDPKLTVAHLKKKQYTQWMISNVNKENFLKNALDSKSLKLTETDTKILEEYLGFVKTYKETHNISI
ncbi:hypothetical protein PInf_008538 [Phytophthora infestans]|nr:hypothetical protein PInf_008538 [Phytophthora infestans]